MVLKIPNRAARWEFVELFAYVIDLAADKYERSHDGMASLFVIDEIMNYIWREYKGGNKVKVLS